MRSQIALSILLLLTLVGCRGEVLTPESTLPTPIPSPVPSTPTLVPTPTYEAQPVIVTLGLWLPEELDPYGGGADSDLLEQQLAPKKKKTGEEGETEAKKKPASPLDQILKQSPLAPKKKTD